MVHKCRCYFQSSEKGVYGRRSTLGTLSAAECGATAGCERCVARRRAPGTEQGRGRGLTGMGAWPGTATGTSKPQETLSFRWHTSCLFVVLYDSKTRPKCDVPALRHPNRTFILCFPFIQITRWTLKTSIDFLLWKDFSKWTKWYLWRLTIPALSSSDLFSTWT